MERETAPPKRQRGREFVTLIIALLLAFSLGQGILSALGATPFIVKALVFIFLYCAFYVLFWRLTERIWRDGMRR